MAFSLTGTRIPTIIGLLILSLGLVGGILLVNTGTSGFLPRASPETTPKNLRITNVSDKSFSVSWTTDSKTPGYIRYGTDPNALNTTITDDRDKISNSVGSFINHHVTLLSLNPSTQYYFKVGTGSTTMYDNAGSPYNITTLSPSTAPAKTVYGDVTNPDGTAAGGTLIYLTADDLAPLSVLSSSTGSWVISLSSARTKNLTSPATLTDTTQLSLLAVSPLDASTSQVSVLFSDAQPVSKITLGSNLNLINSAATPVPSAQLESKFTSQLLSPPTEIGASPTPTVSANTPTISFPSLNAQVLTDKNPTFSGTASAGATVKLSLSGATVLTQNLTLGATGGWTYKPTSALKNGAHTLTVSQTLLGQTLSASKTFTVTAPTPTPTVAGDSTSPDGTNPSTQSEMPVAGSMEYTYGILFVGFLFLGIGWYISAYQKT